MGRRSTQTLKSFLAMIYAVTVVILGGFALFYASAMFEKAAESFRPPQPDVLRFIQGDWQ